MLSIEQFRNIILAEISSLKFEGESFKKLRNVLNKNCNLITANHPCNPKTPCLSDFKSNTETGYQRAIYNNKYSHLIFADGTKKDINWLDLELPVELRNQSRKKCIDLIGKIQSKPIICELKFKHKDSKSNSDRPEYGIFELITYYYLILCNSYKLFKHNVHHESCETFNWKEISDNKPLLLLTANKEYWSYWFNKKTYRPYDTRDTILNLVQHLNEKLEINLCLFETKDIDLKIDDNKKTGNDILIAWEQISII